MTDSGRWWTIEHTADLAVEVEATSPKRVFVTAAQGLTGLLLGAESGPTAAETAGAADWRELELEAPDRPALLVDWLRELLYVHASDGTVFVDAELRECTETRLVARVGFAAPAEGAEVVRELKGVTYHDLEFGRRDDRWYARVVFDV